MTSTSIRATATNPMDDTVHCLWCSKANALCSRRGGSAARFCCAAHRTAYWTACRKLGEQAVALGIVSIADLKADTAAGTLRWSGKRLPPYPAEIGSAEQPVAAPPKRFLI